MPMLPPPLPDGGQYVDSEDSDDEYNNAMCLLDVIITRYLPFLLVPLLGYLTIIYVYPMISFRLEQYLKTENSFYLEQDDLDSDEQKDKMIVAKKLKLLHLECLLVANCYVYFILLWFYISPGESIHYKSKEFHSTIDYIPYIIHNAVSAIVTMVLFAVVIAGFCFKGRKISIILLTSLSISVNIICSVCYFFPKMLVAFTSDLLHAFTVVVIMISLYPLIWYLFVSIILVKLNIKQAYLNLFSCKGLFYILISIAFMLLFCCMGLITSIDIMGILRRSDSQYLQLSCLSVGLLLICLFKLANHCLYDHVINNAKLMMLHVFNYDNAWVEDDKETINITFCNCTNPVFINQSKGNYDIGIKETDNLFQSNGVTVV